MSEEKDEVKAEEKAGWEPSFIKLKELEVVWAKNKKNGGRLDPENLESMLIRGNKAIEEIYQLWTTWRYAVDVLGVRGDAADLTPDNLVKFANDWRLMHKALKEVAKLIDLAKEVIR